MLVVERIRRPTESGRCALRSLSIRLNHLATLSPRVVIGLASSAMSFRYRGRSGDGSTWQGGRYVLSLQHH